MPAWSLLMAMKESNRYCFHGEVVELAEAPAGTYRAKTRGTFTVHGVEREREIECEGIRDQGGLRVRCAFQVILSDHDIPIPKLMFMKIDEVMELELDFFLSTDGGR